MPIISDIAGLGNLVINLVSKFLKVIIEKPYYLIPALLIVLFFPLEIFDWLISFSVNIFIIIINMIIIFAVLALNFIYGYLATTFNIIVVYPLNELLVWLGFDKMDWLPTTLIADSEAMFDRIDLNLFGEAKDSIPAGSAIPHNCLFDWILSLAGLTFPIW